LITNEQSEQIKTKYGKLISTIALNISGDNFTASYEDNVQDLWLSVLEAIDGFKRQGGGVNGEFNDFWGSTGFDKYIKTCLWTKKNNKGGKITKNKGVRNMLSLGDDKKILDIPDKRGTQIETKPSFYQALSDFERDILEFVVENENSLKKNGKINIRVISNAFGISWPSMRKIIDSIGEKINNEL
jgi:hypothetical protein